MAVNLDACFFLAQAAIPHLLESGGNIVNIASNSGLQGVPYSVPYAMSKGGWCSSPARSPSSSSRRRCG